MVRLVEVKGASKTVRLSLPEGLKQVDDVDLLEVNISIPGLVAENDGFTVSLDPFQIRTLKFH